jgi:hypothetical protein
MALISKLVRKVEMFECIIKCQIAWEDITYWYIQALIFNNPNWELEFHVYTNVSQLVVGAILAQNPTSKIDQVVMYTLRL